MPTKDQAVKELAIRTLEKKYSLQRSSLWEFVKFYWENEKKKQLDENRHIIDICDRLEKVYRGEIKRLIINVPPRSLKTEIVSILFPVWCLGNNHQKKFIEVSYSAELAQKNSGHARQAYKSDTYKLVFPRTPDIRQDQDTKQHRENIEGGQYYASGSDGTITGIGADIILIDDPLKPTDAMSDTVRQKVNNNYHDTIESRLNDKIEGAIVIIMQRLHDDDLVGHLIDLEQKGLGDVWEKLIVPAIAVKDERHRKIGESFFTKRFPLSVLDLLKKKDAQIFACQYQQDPVNKETQEFHEEWWRYHGTEGSPTPKNLRVFTAVDPAFKTNQQNDNSCIMTAGFMEDRMYILEYTVGKFSADVLIDKIIYHIRKWSPEKVGIEAYQAQSMILTFLKNELQKQGMYVNIEEITQSGDKITKIRKLIPFYRNGLIYHKYGMDELENEQRRFPRGTHDDIIDAEQMLFDMYLLQPNTIKIEPINISWDAMGRPMVNEFYNDGWLDD